MIKLKSKIRPITEHDNDFMPTAVKEEILICELCPLPMEQCKGENCERYNRLMKEIKAKRKLSKRGYRVCAKHNFVAGD